MKKIVLTGGGTAGHVIPHIALIPLLRDAGYRVHYIGSKEGMEKNLIIDRADVTYHGISSGKLRRYFDLRNVTDQFRIIAGLSQSYKLLKKIRPHVVFSKGGFVSVPVVIAASMLKIPVVIHESDLTSGLANKLSLPFCTTMCTTFESTALHAGKKGVHTGSPVRESIKLGDASRGMETCGFAVGKPVVLIMGGSMGAVAINNCVDEALEELVEKYQIIHIRGAKNIRPKLDSIHGYSQYGYVKDDFTNLLACADIVVSRAGANAIFEFAAMNKPMLLIPLPLDSSRGDQILNAKYFREKGYASMLRQEFLSPNRLVQEIDELYDNRYEYESKMMSQGMGSGLKRLYREIVKASK